MANEIVIVYGGQTVRAIFLYLIPAGDRVSYTDGAGVTRTVVPTPAPIDGELAALLTNAEKTALDAGQAAYESVSFQIDPALSAQDNLAAVRALYADRKAEWLAAYADRYDRYAQRFDAEGA